MTNIVIHSTGKVRVGAVGANLDDTNNLPNIQSIQVSAAFQEALARTAAWISQYPTADAQFDAEFGITFEATGFLHQLLPFAAGLTGVVAGGKTTYTAGLTHKPEYCQCEFIVQAPDGKQVKINIPRAKTFTFNPQHSRGDFQKQSQAIMSRPGDSGTYAAYTVAVDN